GFQPLDLVVRALHGLSARDHNGADRCALPQHGNAEATSKADLAGQRPMLPFLIELDIGYVNNRALDDRPSNDEAPGRARREDAMHLRESSGGVIVLGD